MIVKWVFDRTAALLGLLCLGWFIGIIALLIKWKMPGGPVFFRQQRVGQYGKFFTMIKFRSMCVHHNGNTVSVAGDHRITPLGAVLRKYKIDELPELWNVLKGDMSLVGPRPDVPGYADTLQGDDRRILQLRPGITGPASLKYRHEEELLSTVEDPQRHNDEVLFPDKVRLNLYYLNHYSLFTDLKIIFCTISGRHMRFAEEII